MSELANSASNAAAQAGAYVAALLQTLGSRDPLQVLAETPTALRQAVAGLTPEQDGTPERPGKWSVRQVVQHLADSELVGGFRFRMCSLTIPPSCPAMTRTSGLNAWRIRTRTSPPHCRNSPCCGR